VDFSPPSGRTASGEAQDLARWLHERLRGPRGEADWRVLFEAGWDRALEARVSEILPRALVDRVAHEHLTPDRLAALSRPFAGAILRDAVTDLRQDRAAIERWVPKEARAILDRIATRPGLIDPEWIRSMFRERAVEVVLADTLYAAIRDFATSLPKLIMSMLPKSGALGMLGGAAGLGAKVAEEVERRLEPEIKNFLAGGTKRALEHMAEFTVAHLDDPVSREFRRNFVHFAISRSPAFHVQAVTEEVLTDVSTLVDHIARHVATQGESKEIVKRVLDRVEADWGPLQVKVALEKLGVTERPPIDALAAATWPLVSVILDGPAVKSWLEGLLDELRAKWDEGRTTPPAPVE
jgi:hypothetical protein